MSATAAGRVWREMSIVLTDDAGMVRLNLRHLGRSEATDVLSFGYDPLPGEEDLPSAEVIVNVQRAVEEGVRRQADDGSWGPCHELALYLAHGCNHLTGLNDNDSAGRRRMKKRDTAWVREAQRENLLSGLLEEGDVADQRN